MLGTKLRILGAEQFVPGFFMESLASLDLLTVRERRSYEDLSGESQSRPVCCLVDSSEQAVYYASPQQGVAASMSELRKARTFFLSLVDGTGREQFSLERRGGLFGDRIEIFDAGKQSLGFIQKRGGARAHFRVSSAAGHVLYDIESASASPEIFSIRQAGGVVGKISRRPAKCVESEISQNDHFGIVFPFTAGEAEKGVLLGALFLIDLLF